MKFWDHWNALFGSSQLILSNSSPPHSSLVALEGYGSFTGTTINATLSGSHPLPSIVDAWLGVDYAAQPIGQRRFQPSTWPEHFRGIKEATEYGKKCIQADDVSSQSEACLNMNVYRTKDVPMTMKLPVLVWIHGGGFVEGSGSTSLDGAAFVASSKVPIVTVSFNYRLNSLGFLPSRLFEEEGLLNLGLGDQRLLLEFIQKHISSFGGDPNTVTIAGRSAGAHSVGFHSFHNYGSDTDKPLFARAYFQSGSVTARAFPTASYPLYVQHFASFMEHLQCPISDNVEAMDCLRSVDISKIRDISSKLWTESEYTIRWPFQPTLGGRLLEKSGSQSGFDGTFYHVPIMTSNVNDEGKFYTPGDLETNEDFLDFMHNISPALTNDDMKLVENLYPDPAADKSSPFAPSPNSTQYNRLSAAWSDYAYICPGQETAYRTSLAGVPTWKLRFNTNNSFPPWQGIPHTADTRYTWDSPDVQYPEISHIYHAYLASFVASGDPNTYRYEDSPEWPMYKPGGYGLDSEPGLQLVVQPHNGTKVEEDVIRREACLFWRDPERAGRLNK